jgi:hypothetical protein
MTIEQLGSIGELIAAIATVVTLLYLAIQIRASTIASRVESRRREHESAAPYLTSIIENREVARMFLAGLARDPDLSPEDRTRFAMLMGQIVSGEASFFDEVQLGVGASRRIDERATSIVGFLTTPGGRAWWDRFSAPYGSEFREYYQSKIDAAEHASQRSPTTDST